MALAVAGESPPANESNPELNSILGHSPLKENVGNWGHGGGNLATPLVKTPLVLPMDVHAKNGNYMTLILTLPLISPNVGIILESQIT
jgi:hypothetical protein